MADAVIKAQIYKRRPDRDMSTKRYFQNCMDRGVYLTVGFEKTCGLNKVVAGNGASIVQRVGTSIPVFRSIATHTPSTTLSVVTQKGILL